MKKRFPISVLLLFAAVISVQRLRLSSAPLHGDICAYAVLGHEMLHGRLLYSDLWERKPPLLYITFAAAELITGYGRGEIFLLGLPTALASMLLIFVAGRGTVAGLFAAGMWTLLNCDLDLAANQPDPEIFINLCLIAAFVLLLRSRPGHRVTSSLLLGAALSAATLYKHNTAIVCAALLLGHVLVPRGRNFADRLIDAMIAGGVMIAVWLAVAGYFTATGRLHALVDVLLHQNVSYSGSVLNNLEKSFQFSRVFPSFMIWLFAPALLIAVGAVFSFRNRGVVHRVSPAWWLLLAWAIGTWPTIALTGYLYPHYYQLWIPLACIGGGWAAAELSQAQCPVPTIIRYATLLFAFTFLTFRQGSEFLLTPQQWVQRQFPYFNLVQQNQLGVDLGKVLAPGQQFWELGEDNALYFFSRRSPPTGLLFIDPLIYGDETRVYWDRLLGDLNRSKPAVVILSDNWTKFFPADAPIFPWLQKNYSPWETPLGWPHYRLLRRNTPRMNGFIPATAYAPTQPAMDARSPLMHR